MTDTTTAGLEPAAFCRACGNLVAIRLKDTHREKGCPAKFANILRQYREQHGGAHIALDKTIESIDVDIDDIIKRLTDLEDRPASQAQQAGIAVTDDMDDDSDLTIDDLGLAPGEDVPTVRHPISDTPPPAVNTINSLYPA